MGYGLLDEMVERAGVGFVGQARKSCFLLFAGLRPFHGFGAKTDALDARRAARESLSQ